MIFIKSIKINNFLSFGPQTSSTDMQSLNVMVGANAVGKSNFIEGLEVLKQATEQFSKIQKDGSDAWFFKPKTSIIDDKEVQKFSIEAVISVPNRHTGLRYEIVIAKQGSSFVVQQELITNEEKQAKKAPHVFYQNDGVDEPFIHSFLASKSGKKRVLKRENWDQKRSILAQIYDPEEYPELSILRKVFQNMFIYRDWQFGKYTPARLPQSTDQPINELLPDASNLAMMINAFQLMPDVKKKFLLTLQELYPNITDCITTVVGNTIQLYIQENERLISANRLSDGTLRFLSLLVILLKPRKEKESAILCIEEPELGLHPDMMGVMARLLIDASEYQQLIITTHSPSLIRALSHVPEVILVAENEHDSTVLSRLKAERIQPWLESYDHNLGELWTRGFIGGNRW